MKTKVLLMAGLMVCALAFPRFAHAQTWVPILSLEDNTSLKAVEWMDGSNGGIGIYGGFFQATLLNGNGFGTQTISGLNNTLRLNGTTWQDAGNVVDGYKNAYFHAMLNGNEYAQVEGKTAIEEMDVDTKMYAPVPKTSANASGDCPACVFYDWGNGNAFVANGFYDSTGGQGAAGSAIWNMHAHTVTPVQDSKGSAVFIGKSSYVGDSLLIFDHGWPTLHAIRKGSAKVEENLYPALPSEYLQYLYGASASKVFIVTENGTFYKVYELDNSSWKLLLQLTPLNTSNSNPIAGMVYQNGILGIAGLFNVANGQSSNGTVAYAESTGTFANIAPLPTPMQKDGGQKQISGLWQVNGKIYLTSYIGPNGYDGQTQTVYQLTDAALPVQLLSFTAAQHGSQNLISWATSEEINTSHFDVERSFDGRDFSNIGSVSASGNSNTVQQYQFADIAPLSGSNYYRLKIVDNDGGITYSKIISIEQSGEPVSINLYPNPAVSSVILDRLPEGNVDIQITDAGGRTVQVLSTTVQPGERKTIPVSFFASGIYFVTVRTSTGKTELKFIKQ